MRYSTQVVSLFLVALLYQRGVTSDWPQWMGPHRDGIWPETGLLRDFKRHQPTVKWRVPVHVGYAGPAVVGQRLYLAEFEGKPQETEAGDPAATDAEPKQSARRGVPGIEHIVCIATDTGKELWRHSAQRLYTINYPEGPRATPTVDGDRVYVLGAMGHLLCLNADDGKLIWQKDLLNTYGAQPPVWGYASHPLVDGDRVFCSVGGTGSGIVAWDKYTGAELWRSVTAKEIGYAPPIMVELHGKRQLIFWFDAAVVGLDPQSGQQAWRVDFPLVPTGQVAVTIAQPVAQEDLLLISEFYSGSMLIRLSPSLDAAEPVWHSQPGDSEHEDDLNSIMTTPIVDRDWIYGVSGNGELRCLELASGKLVWRTDQATDKKPRELFGTIFWARNGDRYFVWNDKGCLQVATITQAGYDELGSIKLLEPTGFTRGREFVWSPPAFAQGCMFARNDKELICVDLREPQS